MENKKKKEKLTNHLLDLLNMTKDSDNDVNAFSFFEVGGRVSSMVLGEGNNLGVLLYHACRDNEDIAELLISVTSRYMEVTALEMLKERL